MLKLSIIIPAYNAEKNIKRCLESVQAQTLQNWECIIINDGSIDNTQIICEQFTQQDKRIKLINKYNEGPGPSRNLGIYVSQGEWLGFIDSDDYVDPNHFENLINNAEAHKVRIAQCAVKVYKNGKQSTIWHKNKAGAYYIDDGKTLTKEGCDIGHCWDKVYESKLIKENRIEFNKCDMCEDLIFNVHAFCKAIKFLAISDATYNYFIEDNSLSHSSISGERKVDFLYKMEKSIKDLDKIDTFKFIKQNLISLLESILKRSKSIDYVFPYVNVNSPKWRLQYKDFYKGDIDLQRFNGHEDFLKFKFRSIEKYMPWIDTIHMIVSDEFQIPEWLDTNKVHIVYHQDIIPNMFLPTFNSCTIEMFLHNIFGLSEKFIYSNDDMYATDTLKPEFYFVGDKIRVDVTERKLYHHDDFYKDWAQIILNSFKLAYKKIPDMSFSMNKIYEPQHVGKPMLRSLNLKVFELYKDRIFKSISMFRECKNYNQYIFIFYALFHDLGIFKAFRYKYYQVGYQTNEIIEDLHKSNKKIRAICLNDSNKSTDKDWNKLYNEFITYFSKKSKFEK